MPITLQNTNGQTVRQAQTDQGTNPLAGLTVAQADTWITNNVTNLATAVTALRYIVRVLFLLSFRIAALENRMKNN